ncbi:MAG: hypothetical protein HYV63_13720 [Candidatus Schekmanbacteria bacterium]|nr:hypothetical protein [Candidatus Schekmanbacteria bacterium]
MIPLAALAMVSASLSAGRADPTGRSADGIWTQTDRGTLEASRTSSRPWIRPLRFGAVRLAGDRLSRRLAGAPHEGSAQAQSTRFELAIPAPDGTFERFAIWESPIMAPGLSAWLAGEGWPMRTYAGQGLETPAATIRFDWGGPAGFHATVLSPHGSYQIDPYWHGDRELYTSYYVRDLAAAESGFRCGVTGHLDRVAATSAPRAAAGTLRTYRLANAATGEYTAFHGGTQAAGQAAVVTTVNRVNQVYERDLSVRLLLIESNQSIVYTDAVADPYTNDDGFEMLDENQSNLDQVIGTASYDIGHVFSTGGGGIAGLGVVCNSSRKAEGVTGQESPEGDAFDIDYVAHEMGHQFGANHPFDGISGACSGGNRNDSTAYEPGSGSTIMAYAGICGADNLQPHSDDLFTAVSLDEILSLTDSVACQGTIASGNQSVPTVDAGPSYTIPHRTPFELTALSGSDSDGDALTYTWEEFDLKAGPFGTLLAQGDLGDNPIIRTWEPSTSPMRVIPRLEDLLANTTSAGELLPTTSRSLTFRVVVRDNHAGGGLVDSDTMQVTTTTDAGPFRVTAPTSGQVAGPTLEVRWEVANTNASTVNASTVEILLSTDGGQTWPIALAQGTANDGSETVGLYGALTSTARIKVKGSNNIFFALSEGNFQIAQVVPAPSPAALVLALGALGLVVLAWPAIGRRRDRSAGRGQEGRG